MKARTLIVPLLSLFVAGSYGAVKQDQNDKLAQRVEMLEKRLDTVETYLQAQAASAKRLNGKLEESRKAGFTYGINPESREVLLTGFTDLASTAQQNVPGAKKDEKE